ncbi:hypothetical protein AV926_04970 [Myroides marinus]|uniref:Uncharacterized protein n=1 Tax=Myroides marinus TaxID=703342 RepID=A0A161SB24_9FLAO|nr:hypothetical protein [Myroides marinus]KZE82904.1 hypothetical protein AV926_04970 [Myroides marinus]
MNKKELEIEIEKKYHEVFEKYKLTFNSSLTNHPLYSNPINELQLVTSFYESEEFININNHFNELIKTNQEAKEFVSKKIQEIHIQLIKKCYT